MTDNVQTHISNGGRVVIPIEFRKILGLGEGDMVTVSMDAFGIRISTPRLALRKLQSLALKKIPKGKRISDELIADRRKEARREQKKIRKLPGGKKTKR